MSERVRIAIWISLLGFILSGPVGLVLVTWFGPQPEWISAVIFAEHYREIQALPYYFGFFLIGGMVMLVLAHFWDYRQKQDPIAWKLGLSLGLVLVFATLITFNYICQTTFVRQMATHYQPLYEPLLAAFSMSNPFSLAWAIEMWGYGILGISLWLLSDQYREKNRWIPPLLLLNMILSLASLAWTIVDARWVLTGVGLGLYLAWNVLMILILAMILKQSGKFSST